MSRTRTYAAYVRRLARRETPGEEPGERPQVSRADRLRAARLARIPADRKCPECRRVVPEPRRWSIPLRGVVRCLSCSLKASRSGGGLSRAERRRRARHAKIPKDRRCPTCSSLVLEPRKWYTGSAGGVVECLSCRRSR